MTQPKTTVVTCPSCEHSCFTPSIISTHSVFDESQMEDVTFHRIQLTCLHCSTALQFVVDLQPSFDRSETACSAST